MELSRWLRGVLLFIFACCLVLGAIAVPAELRALTRASADFEPLQTGGLVFFWLSLLPVFAALTLAWCIFTDIGRDESFSEKNARRLRAISRLSLADTALYALAAVSLAFWGLLRVYLPVFIAVIFLGIFLTIASAALSHLCHKAAALKSENDLTI